MQHIIPFNAYLTSPDLAAFLLENRYVRVHATAPELTSVRITLEGTHTVKPHHVVSLACLLEEYYAAGIPIAFTPCATPAYGYLQNIGFLDMWGTERPTAHTGFTPMDDPTAFAVWKASPELMTDYVLSAYDHFKYRFFEDKDISFLPTYLTELFNNVFDHAFAEGATERSAFGMLQYYPTTKRLFASVSDFGMGISTSVNRFLRSRQESELLPMEALRKATELHFSSHSRPHNKGRGLDTLRVGLTALRGTLTIQTSHALYHLSRDGKESLHSLPGIDFPGTTVTIKLSYGDLEQDSMDEIQEEAALF
ncbi:hypothetical protein [Hymenobacter sp. HDW8]|uniref:hypothetical protein n=1 Tax=Hymenobacter sp. HDW8 TaxID=2714932 RepID=UPI001409439D|nr:hypothetical protein [Hymenobacter sp. HDW8]QIL78379.1 hypothetical protein G7064_21425 [Hymenobacter sp. HDW8]